MPKKNLSVKRLLSSPGKYIILGMILVLVVPVTAAGTGLTDADDPAFPEGYVNFDRIGCLGLIRYPAADLGRKYNFHTSYHKLYGLSRLTDSRAAGAVKWKGFTLATALGQFGTSDYYQQTSVGLTAGYDFNPIRIGFSGVYRRVEFGGGYGAKSLIGINGGLQYQVFECIMNAAVRSINRPRYNDSDLRFPYELETGLSYKTNDLLDSQVKILFNEKEKPSAALSQSIGLTEHGRLNYTIVFRPVRIGFGLIIEKDHFGFEYHFNHHPALGETHRIYLSVF